MKIGKVLKVSTQEQNFNLEEKITHHLKFWVVLFCQKNLNYQYRD